MRRVALRGIRSQLGRFLLSVLAVLLGVAFVAGTFSLRSMMSSTFTDIIESSFTGDAYVRGSERLAVDDGAGGGAPGMAARNGVPLELEETVAGVEGVEAVVPEVSGPVVLVGADGTAVLSSGPPSFAVGLHPDDPSARVVDGRAPAGPDEIGLESATLEASGLAVGDSTTVVVGGALVPVEVVAEVAFGAPVAGATIVFLDLATAEAAYAPEGEALQLAVHAVDGLDEETVVARVADALATAGDVEVVTGEQAREENVEAVQEVLGFISTFLLVFAAVALFVGAFIIANTFQMVVRQRQREYAMLRAVGASPTQVFGAILAQAAVVGVAGSVLGVGAGVGLVSVLRVVLAQAGMELSGRIPLDGSTVAISVVTGTVVSVLAAAVPARKAALTPPVEAMRDDVVVRDRASVVRAAVGAVLLAGGLAALAAAMADLGDGGPLLGLGAAGVLVGVLALAPTVVPVALGALAAPAVAAMRPLGGLARGNVTRNPRRTASTAGALMIGMALVAAAAVIASSTQASTRAVVENESTSDLLLQSATRAVPEELVGLAGDVDGVAHADALRVGGVVVDGASTTVVGAADGMFGRSLDIEVVDGDLDRLADGGLAVHEDLAEDEGWGVGDVVTLTGAQGERDLEVVAVVDSAALGGALVLGEAEFAAVVAPTEAVVDTVFVVAEDGADLAALRDGLTEAAAPFVVVSVMDNEEFADELAGQVDQILVILYALLGLSIVIAVLGIVNTLALSVAERTREIGLLRAVGLGRLQLASVVTVESVLTAVFGTVLGLAVGTGLAATLPTVFADEGLTELDVPWDQLGAFLALAVVVGVVAALWPAVRAARMDVLQAVSYE